MTDYKNSENCEHDLEYPFLDDSGNILYWTCICGYRVESGLEDERNYDDEDLVS